MTPEKSKHRWWVWVLLLCVAGGAMYLYPRVIPNGAQDKGKGKGKGDASGGGATLIPLEIYFRRGYAKLYHDSVLQADQGCDFDFLRG